MIALTVDVEEGFYGLRPSTRQKMTRHRLEIPTGEFIGPLRSILELFERERVRSTFFVLGRVAEVFPWAVEEIHDLGHEVASHGYFHVDLTKIPLTEFATAEKKSRSIFAKITGEAPRGFRAPFFRINNAIFSLLSDLGYVYDSSVVPSFGIPLWWSSGGSSLSPYSVDVGRNKFVEVPIAVFPHLCLPVGGWFLRNFGVTYAKVAIKWFLRRGIPVVVYVHPFDVNPNAKKLGRVSSYMTRHCGEYTLRAVENVLKSFDCPKIPIRDMLETVMLQR